MTARRARDGAAKTALIINLEHVAAVRTKYWGPHLRKSNSVAPMRWWVWGSKPLLDIALKSWAKFNVGLTEDIDNGASGEIGQVARDAPSMQVITSPEAKHTEEDTEEWVPAAGLEQVARSYAKIIDDINKLSRRELMPAAAGTAAWQQRTCGVQRSAAGVQIEVRLDMSLEDVLPP